MRVILVEKADVKLFFFSDLNPFMTWYVTSFYTNLAIHRLGAQLDPESLSLLPVQSVLEIRVNHQVREKL